MAGEEALIIVGVGDTSRVGLACGAMVGNDTGVEARIE